MTTVQNDIGQIISIVCVVYFRVFVKGKPLSFSLLFQGTRFNRYWL